MCPVQLDGFDSDAVHYCCSMGYDIYTLILGLPTLMGQGGLCSCGSKLPAMWNGHYQLGHSIRVGWEIV